MTSPPPAEDDGRDLYEVSLAPDVFRLLKAACDHQPLGTGMGLPIARRYARLMAGDVNIDTGRSETCFFVELPRLPAEDPT